MRRRLWALAACTACAPAAPTPPTSASTTAVLGSAIEYDLGALRYLFDHVPGTPQEYERVARTMCVLDIDDCDRLGAQLLVDGREDEAARVYDDWFDKARDRVGASNGISWLVHYHLDAGNTERARHRRTRR